MCYPDEIFYYPYSDCPDNTVLFTKQVSSLLGLDVVEVEYRNHMTAAVAFNEPIEGHRFIVDGKNYTICDPTYIDAPIGSIMPKYKDYFPHITKINNNSKLNNIWQHITQTTEEDNQGKIFIDHREISEDGKYIVGREVEKMSKSKYNVVSPDDICEDYGADTLRLSDMFRGHLEQTKPWNRAGITGVQSFLKKLRTLTIKGDSLYIANYDITIE